MLAPWLSRSFSLMHPTLMTIYANAKSEALRDAADKRRRFTRTRERSGFALHVPRFGARAVRV
jgi:hypothetical protein